MWTAARTPPHRLAAAPGLAPPPPHGVYRYRRMEMPDSDSDEEVAAVTGDKSGTESEGEAALRADLQRRRAARRAADPSRDQVLAVRFWG